MTDGITRVRHGLAFIALVGFILIGTFGQARAEEPQNATSAQQSGATPGMVITMRLYEGVIRCPMPLWIKEPKQIGDSKMSRNQQKNLFSFEMIPKAQEFSNWTRLYGVYGFYLPEHNLKRFFDESMNALALGCKAQGQAHILSAGDNAITLEYYCPELRPEVVTDGNTVERGFLFISHTGKSYAKVYQAWRGAANATETEDWPTNPKVEEAAIKAMASMRFFPANAK